MIFTCPATAARIASKPEWTRNPIDNFILARLDQEGLAPSPEADRETLLRRLSLDLIGLPPTLEDIAALRADIEARDARDQSRVASPQTPAEDALRLDNSALGIDESVDVVQGWWQQRNPLDQG